MTPEDNCATKEQVMPDANLAYLDAELRILRLRLDNLTVTATGKTSAETVNTSAAEISGLEAFLASLRAAAEKNGWRLHFRDIAATFRLTEFERQLLLLAAAPDLDENFGAAIAQAHASGGSWPSVGLAWRLFCPSLQACVQSRDSLREDAPILRFRLLEMGGQDAPLPDRFLRADRRVTDALAGRTMPDARIAPLLRYAPGSAANIGASTSGNEGAFALAERLRAFLAAETPVGPQLVVNLFDASCADAEAFAAQACNAAGLSLLSVNASAIAARDIPILIRESLLSSCALFIWDIDSQPGNSGPWPRWLADGGPLVFIGSEQPLALPPELRTRVWLPLSVPRLGVSKRMETWRSALEPRGLELNGSLATLAANFYFSDSEIKQAARRAGDLAWLRAEPIALDHVLSACRSAVRHQMAEVAQQIIPSAGWDDLLLPDEPLTQLRELCSQVRCQQAVLDQFGFRGKLSRGRGVTALFAGPSGTGKTMAAEVVARDLQRDFYRVDLARVVSKYIGETEKNLRRIFVEAERARCVVLFDEADALFGRRTEVRDSHDRYANLEVSYLLQLMEETEEAVVLLATNRRDAIDEAFLRRFRFMLDFPLPGPELRRRLWAGSFPTEVQIRGVKFDVLADRVPLSGASIKNIALAATYLAASDGGVVGIQQIAHAARRELGRMGRPAPFTEADLDASPGERSATK